MKVSVLASGSKGNVSYIETEQTKLLVDLGMTSLYVETKLKKIGVKPSDIDAVVLTHTHSDHINGLKVFCKKYHPKVYLTDKMLKDVKQFFDVDNYEMINGDFQINDLEVEIIKTSHDVSDSNGYIFTNNNKSITYITDTGYINRKYHEKLKNKNIYIMESNHDVKMLQNGKYPYHLKQRILSDNGHLSNEMSAKYLREFIGNKTEKVILIHLSHENNDPDIALETLQNILKENNKRINDILISKQDESTELIEI